MASGRIRKNRMRNDRTVRQAEEHLEQKFGLRGADIVDPRTNEPFRGNMKLRTVGACSMRRISRGRHATGS